MDSTPADPGASEQTTASTGGEDTNQDLSDTDAPNSVGRRVAWIGAGWRWYDIPYRLGGWMLSGWRRRLLGWRGVRFVNRWMNYLIPFNQLEQERGEARFSWMRDLDVPADEHVHHGGVWVIEVFPPSHYGALVSSLRRNGWDRDDFLNHQEASSTEKVRAARSGRGWAWWRLGDVVDPRSGLMGIGANLAHLPQEFSMVDIRAMQVGSSLTMVSAFFRVSDLGRDLLDATWHAAHEPRLTMRGRRRPQLDGRHSAATRAGQAERLRIHDVARDWLAKRCPGAFALAPGRHPVIDLMLLEQFDPSTQAPSRDDSDALRAIGLDGLETRLYQSPQMPGMVLVPSSDSPRNYNVIHNCWGAVGQNARITELNQRAGYGEPPYSAQTVAHMFDDELRAFSQYVAVNRYLANLQESYSNARDVASTQHGRFSSRRLKHLRSQFLTTGLYLATVGPDTAHIWDKWWRSFEGVEVAIGGPVGLPEGSRSREETDFVKHLNKVRKSRLRELRAVDSAYRETLVTAASLGASVDASRTGRRALWVSAASLAVAMVALLLADTSASTLWSQMLDRFGS